jgi:hypothetical protein
MNTIPGITIERDDLGNERFIRIDLDKYAQLLRPFMITTGLIEEKPEDWDDALTSNEFLSEVKKMMKKKFDDKHKIQ